MEARSKRQGDLGKSGRGCCRRQGLSRWSAAAAEGRLIRVKPNKPGTVVVSDGLDARPGVEALLLSGLASPRCGMVCCHDTQAGELRCLVEAHRDQSSALCHRDSQASSRSRQVVGSLASQKRCVIGHRLGSCAGVYGLLIGQLIGVSPGIIVPLHWPWRGSLPPILSLDGITTFFLTISSLPSSYHHGEHQPFLWRHRLVQDAIARSAISSTAGPVQMWRETSLCQRRPRPRPRPRPTRPSSRQQTSPPAPRREPPARGPRGQNQGGDTRSMGRDTTTQHMRWGAHHEGAHRD